MRGSSRDARQIRAFSALSIFDFARRQSEGSPVKQCVVTPYVNIEKGVITEVLPYRAALWSPMTDGLPMYEWLHAEFWWRPADLIAGGLDASSLARGDALCLEVVLQNESSTQMWTAQKSLEKASS